MNAITTLTIILAALVLTYGKILLVMRAENKDMLDHALARIKVLKHFSHVYGIQIRKSPAAPLATYTEIQQELTRMTSNMAAWLQVELLVTAGDTVESIKPLDVVICDLCRKPLEQAGDPGSKNYGGSCLRCMAIIGEDPHCIAELKEVDPDFDPAFDPEEEDQ